MKNLPSPDETGNTRTPIDGTTRQLESLGYFGGDEQGFDSTVYDSNAGDSVASKLAADSFHYKQEITAKPTFEFAQDSGQVQGKYDSDRQVAEKKAIELARNSGILGAFSFDNSEVKQNAQHETAESKEGLFDDIANLKRD
ncbi:MAG: hypothetical protein JKY56_08355, partial [Kofleriaceae bacterium]|nr:hypothetical protein [Kofleriaceae bacterium]